MATLATEVGRITLMDMKLDIADGMESRQQLIDSEDQYREILERYFRIVISDGFFR